MASSHLRRTLVFEAKKIKILCVNFSRFLQNFIGNGIRSIFRFVNYLGRRRRREESDHESIHFTSGATREDDLPTPEPPRPDDAVDVRRFGVSLVQTEQRRLVLRRPHRRVQRGRRKKVDQSSVCGFLEVDESGGGRQGPDGRVRGHASQVAALGQFFNR